MNRSRLVDRVRGWIDVRDVFVFAGLSMLGYGLYGYRPWVAYAVCGGILLLIGLFDGRGKD